MTDPGSFEHRVRQEAMRWLTVRTNDGQDEISSQDLLDFAIDGEPFRLLDAQRGIRKPAAFAAALAIRTTYTSPSQERPYDDNVGADGLLRYKWRGIDPDHPENRSLREAMRLELPLIWFFGVGPGVYRPVFPVFLLWEEAASHQFVIDPDVARGLVAKNSPVEEHLRRYILRETKQRLHQPVFRATVLRVYQKRCAVCALGHTVLLDAAHIIPDRHEEGIASVTNGLAMCKIHHAAFDNLILGITPDLIVQIRPDLLDEKDGPMLQHGLKERHGERLMVIPNARAERPNADLLARAYQRFKTA
ncbi:putative restriction endonuclease [Jatrophihabitans sp. GAS493]|uniref:HNH endonuclease n=1 Tax=Jatrophihabitans sp. GAS493 TaxID=1907575 RepID=UPI000BBF4BD7|nr:HNH endonuclease [Jatrophihabitans sp. GAS493]SOD70787.1 putative restriction endonuclease [Jatrophihabitans sp. GAS493]